MLKTDIGGHLSKLPAAADEHDASTLSSTLSSLSARVVSGCGAVRGQKRSLYPPDPTMESPGKTSIWDGEMGKKIFPLKRGGGWGKRCEKWSRAILPSAEPGGGGGCWLEESWKKTKLITRRRRKVDSAPLYPPEGKKEKFKLSRAYCTYPVGIKRREEPALFP